MLSLKKIQEDLVDSIFRGKGTLDFIKTNGSIKAEQRLQVHLDTIFENFVNALKIVYPGIWRLIGSDCARGVALAYGHDFINITDRSNINSFGKNFPDFLKYFPSTKHLDYLPDYANLEYLRSESYKAQNQRAINTEQFNKSLQSNPDSVIFEFNHSVFFLRSNWSLAKIQQMLDEPDSKKIELNYEECFILICRVYGRVETLFLQKGEWEILFALKNKRTLEQALEYIETADDADVKIANIISLLFTKEMISRVIA
jgi:tetratricopeptide (TPR) repeat protein